VGVLAAACVASSLPIFDAGRVAGAPSTIGRDGRRLAGLSVSYPASLVVSSQRLAMLLPITTTPITSRTTTMIVTLFSTSQFRNLSNGPRIRADATR
jgi:hypothetical protein